MTHIPVLANEAVDALNVRPGFSYIDGTAGQGGHSVLIAKAMGQPSKKSQARLHLIDKDKEAIHAVRKRLRDCGFCRFHTGSFSKLSEYVEEGEKVGGVLLDLGISRVQLGAPERGFSFNLAGPLDMRIDKSEGMTAAEFINRGTEEMLTQIISDYGEERFTNRIVRAIITERELRPIITTTQLAEIVAKVIPKRFHGKTHPATKTFMALRIAVNDELAELSFGLKSALNVLAPTGRLAVITFHSLEDRIVKRFMAERSKGCVCPPLQPYCSCGAKSVLKVIGKMLIPSAKEKNANPSARSAKLRVAERQELIGGTPKNWE